MLCCLLDLSSARLGRGQREQLCNPSHDPLQFDTEERRRFPATELAILAIWGVWMPLLLLLIRFRWGRAPAAKPERAEVLPGTLAATCCIFFAEPGGTCGTAMP